MLVRRYVGYYMWYNINCLIFLFVLSNNNYCHI
jgi:hypothetical protein